MAGAPIPNDWDGSTFKCMRIEWPSSEQWEAILLGQMTEAIKESYWDADTGNPANAAAAAKDAYLATTPGIWVEECDEPMLVPSFGVKNTIGQTFLAGQWQPVEFDQFSWETNSPQFNLLQGTHDLFNSDLFGLWHYDVQVALAAGSALAIRAGDAGSPLVLREGFDSARFAKISFNWLWDTTDLAIQILVYPFLAASLETEASLTLFSGFFVGPVA